MTCAGLFLAAILIASAQSVPCGDEDLRALLRSQEHLVRGDEPGARKVLEAAKTLCPQRQLALLASRGWAQARALAAGGGATDLQGPVRATLDELRRVESASDFALEVEYADALIRAAIAAAQDERPEMELLLAHARDLSERLRVRERRAVWPLSWNLAAGELWFEVDRYEDAAAAYDRAGRADASPRALVGLARSLARLDRLEEACRAYRRVTDAAPELLAQAKPDLVRCP